MVRSEGTYSKCTGCMRSMGGKGFLWKCVLALNFSSIHEIIEDYTSQWCVGYPFSYLFDRFYDVLMDRNLVQHTQQIIDSSATLLLFTAQIPMDGCSGQSAYAMQLIHIVVPSYAFHLFFLSLSKP